MRGMILAAGRGQRMGDLTQSTPKPLLKAGARRLIEYSIDCLVKAKIYEIVINVSYLADNIIEYLGDGQDYGAKFYYSYEPQALETAGGIVNALPLLTENFIVMSCDIVTNFDLTMLNLCNEKLAHLLLVDNPSYASGDFSLRNGNVYVAKNNPYTFAGIGIFKKSLFENLRSCFMPLGPLLKAGSKKNKISGMVTNATWFNVGTPLELSRVSESLVCF